MKKNGTNVLLAQNIVFGNQAGENVDVMVDIKKLMDGVLPLVAPIK